MMFDGRRSRIASVVAAAAAWLIAGASAARDSRCTSTLDVASLPESWRGYDAVDELGSSPAGSPSLTGDQRAAINRWTIRRANDLSVGLAAPPAAPGRVLAQMPMLIAASAALFLLVVAAARSLARRSFSLYAALAWIVAAGSAAALAQGRIGAGASILLTDSTIVRGAEGVDDAFVSTRGVARFPALGSFELSPAFEDGVVTARQEPARATFADDGASVLSGVFGKNQRVEFELEGFSGLPTVRVIRSAETTRIVNVASTDLTDCAVPSGLLPRRVVLLRA